MALGIRPRNRWDAFAVLLLGALVHAPLGVAAAQEAASRSYPVSLAPGFESNRSLEEVEQIALTTLAGPISTVTWDAEGGGLRLQPAPPKILYVAGCRGEDLPSIDPRVGADSAEFVWFVLARGSFVVLHEGRMNDREGFLLIHPDSGVAFRIGVFPESEN